MVAGDILIDDKPYEFLSPGGKHTTATWKVSILSRLADQSFLTIDTYGIQQIIFDAPYNRQMRLPRMFHWKDWRNFVYPMLGKKIPSELYSYSKDEADGKVLLDPFRRPNNISVPNQLRRNASFSSIHSGMSADDVQKQIDMLQQSDTPLNAEDMATIVSGSLSLVGENSSDEESIYEDRLKKKQSEFLGDGGDSHGSNVQSEQLAQKKKALHDKLQQRSEQYKKTKESTEKKMALETDSTEVEGLQLFRTSYDLWKRASGFRSSGNTPGVLPDNCATSNAQFVHHPPFTNHPK